MDPEKESLLDADGDFGSERPCGRDRGGKSGSWIRWPVLLLACTAMFGSYYCYDNPGALANVLIPELGLSNTQYNLLYTVYSVPNVVLPFFGGLLVDRLSTNVCIVLFLAFIIAGHAVFALGATIGNFPVMALGRMLFGIGGESLSVAETTMLSVWFKGREIAFSMGVNLTLARLGSVANDNVSPWLYNIGGLNLALWIGVGLTGFCMLCVFAMVLLDRYASRKFDGHESQWKDPETHEVFSVRDLAKFSTSFKLITLSCLLVYGAVLPFNNVAGNLLHEKYGYSMEEAGAIMGIPFIISAVMSPFMGSLVDIFGCRAILLASTSLLLAIAHSLIAFTLITPYVPLVLLGVSYSIYASAMWPSVAYVVEQRLLGTAYGIVTAVQNAGLAVFPLIIGAIKDKTGTYKYPEIFFLSITLMGFVVALWLNYEDYFSGGTLNSVRLTEKVRIVDYEEISQHDDT